MNKFFLAFLASLPFLASCEAPLLDPSQQQRTQFLEQSVVDLEAQLDNLERKLMGYESRVTGAVNSPNPSAALQSIYEDFMLDKEEYKRLLMQRQDATREISQIEQDAMAAQTSAVHAWVDQSLPDGPWKTLGLAAVLFGSRVVTKRGRKHVTNAGKALVKGSIADSISAIFAALGYGSGSPDDALESAKLAAEKDNDTALAQALQNALSLRKAEEQRLSGKVLGIPQPVPQPLATGPKPSPAPGEPQG